MHIEAFGIWIKCLILLFFPGMWQTWSSIFIATALSELEHYNVNNNALPPLCFHSLCKFFLSAVKSLGWRLFERNNKSKQEWQVSWVVNETQWKKVRGRWLKSGESLGNKSDACIREFTWIYQKEVEAKAWMSMEMRNKTQTKWCARENEANERVSKWSKVKRAYRQCVSIKHLTIPHRLTDEPGLRRRVLKYAFDCQ